MKRLLSLDTAWADSDERSEFSGESSVDDWSSAGSTTSEKRPFSRSTVISFGKHITFRRFSVKSPSRDRRTTLSPRVGGVERHTHRTG